jgi:hypothetical protein
MTITSIPAAPKPAEPRVLVTTHSIPLEHKRFPITTPFDKTNIPRKVEEMSLVESWVVLQACHAGSSQLHGSAGSCRTGTQIRKRSHATYPYLAHTTSNYLLSITSVSVHCLFFSTVSDNFVPLQIFQILQIQSTKPLNMAGAHVAEGYQVVASEPTSVSTGYQSPNQISTETNMFSSQRNLKLNEMSRKVLLLHHPSTVPSSQK